MNQKTDITKYVMTQLGIEFNDKNFKKYLNRWWQNPRTKSKGGLWLTEYGFASLQKADIKSYKISLEEEIEFLENGFIIWLDRTMDYPFYLTPKELYTFGERTVIQMVLFSGNLKLWQKAHTRNKSLNS